MTCYVTTIMRHVTEQVNHPPLLEEGEGDTLFRSNFIMEQGTVGQEMYVIITGDAVVVEQDGLKIGTLNSGDFFGEPVPERGITEPRTTL
jgi:CRP-like cAMP-binding protein